MKERSYINICESDKKRNYDRNREITKLKAAKKKWYFVTKIVLIYCEKKIVLVIEKKKMQFEAESREFAKILRSLNM